MPRNKREPYKKFDENQLKIKSAYDQYIVENPAGGIPSFKYLADKTGLTQAAIYKHFDNLDFDYICKRQRINTPAIVEAIARAAMDGKPQAQKLYMQIMEGYVEKKEQKSDIVGELNTNTNVSGELSVTVEKKIIYSKGDLDTLPPDIKEQIEKEAEPEPPKPEKGYNTRKIDKINKDADIDLEIE